MSTFLHSGTCPTIPVPVHKYLVTVTLLMTLVVSAIGNSSMTNVPTACVKIRYSLPRATRSTIAFDIDWYKLILTSINVKAAHTRLPNVVFRRWSRFLAVSLQVTWVVNPAVGCHYFPPSPQLGLPSQPLGGLLPISLLGEQRDDGCEQFA